ncbi:L,D-transpeptidase family protein [Peptoniphilus equinus]|uniref:L,D-transpeptidase family protein n=1 Tax=Peptoniphilus equinus TaxID=3016343 RepID=A0ABY7QW74_9FIRM|nr:L,D-transpeptidase family protein [Peptoniphilus equinus]WBW50305.1 L,D-transpeptidase family protein [Peptoniphilus equinus]
MKKLILAVALVLVSTGSVFAAYVRPNTFMDKTGYRKVEEVKRFQALNNIDVDGVVGPFTQKVLYGPNMVAADVITAKPTTGDWIVINKSKKILTYYRGDKPLYKFPVTLGTSETPTPSAKATIVNKHKNPAWGGMGGKYTPAAADDPNNPLGERWMGLNIPGMSGYGIHGNIKPHQIGTYSSNGCIRMFNYDIETFIFPQAKVGMPVWIGTDAELKSWGVEQLIFEDTQPAVPETPKAPQYDTEELLVF